MFFSYFLQQQVDFATKNPGLKNTSTFYFKDIFFAFLQHAKIELPLSHYVDPIASAAGNEYVIVDVV